MEEGYVKFFNPVKGYGFIKGEKKEYFFHVSDIDPIDAQDIGEGAKVEFETVSHPKGEKATKVKILK